MYNPKQFLLWSRLALVALLLLILSAICQAQEAPTTNGEANLRESASTPLNPLEIQIETWTDYDTASQEFENMLTKLTESWETFAPLLEKLGISFEDFPAYIDNLILASKNLEESIGKERASAIAQKLIDDAEINKLRKERDTWKIVSGVSITAATLGAIFTAIAIIK